MHARALALTSPEDRVSGVILVVADLCLMTPDQAGAIRSRISERVGVPPESVLVSCTHTHSGPDTGLGSRMTQREEPGHVAYLMESLVLAGCGEW